MKHALALGVLLAAAPAYAGRFAVYGDTRDNDAEHARIVGNIAAARPDFALFTGDAVKDGADAAQWDTFSKLEKPLLGSVPIYGVRGNHDHGERFRKILALPTTVELERAGGAYSFDADRVHVLGLDTEEPLGPGSAQLAFAAHDLAVHAGQPTVVFLHRALFSSGNHGGDHDLQALLQPLFDKSHVLAVFQGHDHDYERSQPIHGVTYFVEGGGGAKLRPFEGKPPSWSAFRFLGFGYVLVDVLADALDVQAFDSAGNLLDRAKVPFAAPAPGSTPPAPGAKPHTELGPTSRDARNRRA